jgi:predicted transcriptional regulator
MTLTVRLPEPLDRALDEYCAAHGTTKSHVVQECLAEYLVRSVGTATATKEVSANYAAFKRAGLLGCATGEGVSATNEVVRKRVLERLKARR